MHTTKQREREREFHEKRRREGEGERKSLMLLSDARKVISLMIKEWSLLIFCSLFFLWFSFFFSSSPSSRFIIITFLLSVHWLRFPSALSLSLSLSLRLAERQTLRGEQRPDDTHTHTAKRQTRIRTFPSLSLSLPKEHNRSEWRRVHVLIAILHKRGVLKLNFLSLFSSYSSSLTRISLLILSLVFSLFTLSLPLFFVESHPVLSCYILPNSCAWFPSLVPASSHFLISCLSHSLCWLPTRFLAVPVRRERSTEAHGDTSSSSWSCLSLLPCNHSSIST